LPQVLCGENAGSVRDDGMVGTVRTLGRPDRRVFPYVAKVVEPVGSFAVMAGWVVVACSIDEVGWTDSNALIVEANSVDASEAGVGAAVKVVEVEQVKSGTAGSRCRDPAAT